VIHVKYKLEKSKIHGIGLFADEDLQPGQLVYTASPALDVDIPMEEFEALDEKGKQEIRQWGFLMEPEDVWHVDFDISRFVSQSFEPNLIQDPNHQETYLVAAREIKAGEELTQNYLEPGVSSS
jgi:SET domain-containing protein